MINLLPLAAKKQVRREYWVRVATAWLMLWTVALFVGASILLPAYVLVGSQISVYELSADEASEQVESYQEVRSALTAASEQARLVVDEAELPVMSKLIDVFEDEQGTDIEFTELQLSREGTDIAPVSISGVAADRQALASFRDRLLALEQVSTVDLPISNLASDRDIKFTLTVTLTNSTDV